MDGDIPSLGSAAWAVLPLRVIFNPRDAQFIKPGRVET